MSLEIERKFLVTSLCESVLKKGVRISQGYMTRGKNLVSRVRIYGNNGYLTIKGPSISNVRHEFEYPIPLEDARQMLTLFCSKPLIEKTRYQVFYKEFEWVVDRFSGENQGLAVAEIELPRPDTAFEKPPWIGKEVSSDPRYFNSNLVDHPFCRWTENQ